MDPATLGRLAVEAGASIVLPCSATIIVPTAVVALLGRGRTGVVVAVLGGAVVGALGVLGLVPTVPDVIVGLVFAGGSLTVLREARQDPPGPATGAGASRWRGAAGPLGAAAAGVASGVLWMPCVGAELGTLLTAGVRDPWPAAAPLALFVLVLCLPVVVLAALVRTGPGRRLLDGWPLMALGVVALALGMAVVVGFGDDVTGALFRWST